jgi:hypothetical protein
VLQVEKYEDADTGETFEMLAFRDGVVVELEVAEELALLRCEDPEGFEAVAHLISHLRSRAPLASIEA